MWLLAWKNIVRRKSQSLLTVIITLLTICTFVLIFSITLVVQDGLKLSKERLGADIIVLPDEAKADASQILFTAQPANIYMSKELVNILSKYDGVEQISPQFFTQTLSADCCSYGNETRVVGFDEKTDFILKPFLREQNIDKLEDDQIIVGCDVESFLGNQVSILGKVFRVAGTLHPTGSGIDNTIYLNMDAAVNLVEDSVLLQDKWVEEQPEELVSSIFIKTKNGINPSDVAKKMNVPGLAVQAIATSDTINSAKIQMEIINKIIFGLWITSLLIAALSLFGRFNSLAKERQKEIGMMRALGIQKKQIFNLILSEAWIMCFAGGVLGSILGIIVANPILKILKEIFVIPSMWSNKAAIISGITGVFVALLLGFMASAYPAIKSASLDPQDAITRGVL